MINYLLHVFNEAIMRDQIPFSGNPLPLLLVLLCLAKTKQFFNHFLRNSVTSVVRTNKASYDGCICVGIPSKKQDLLDHSLVVKIFYPPQIVESVGECYL